jgi:hypothetical protein
MKPSLEWLRKAAKDLLDELRATEPDAQLADAQLAIARREGFPSWRALKTHVDAMHDEGAHLVAAVRAGDVARVAAILDRHPSLVRATDDKDERDKPIDTRRMTLLHLCVAENQLEVAKLVIARGADLDARNLDGRAPLHDAFEMGRDDLAELLVTSGATVDVVAAAAFGKHDRLLEILRADPAAANDLSTGGTPLGWAAYANDTRAAQILIDHGAIVDAPPYDYEVWTPTAAVCNVPFARVLLAAGADARWTDAEGDNLLHHALHSRLVVDPAAFVELLLEAGADPLHANDRGVPPLDDAIARASAGDAATTYFPITPLGTKRLDRTIELMTAAASAPRRTPGRT